MDITSKLRDPRAIARWHNIWLGTTIFFFVSAAVFAGLFGWKYTQWQHEAACLKGVADWKYVTEFDLRKHAIALHEGRHLAIMGHAVTDAPCILKMHDTLRARGQVYTPAQGRRMSYSGMTYLETLDKTEDYQMSEMGRR